MTETARQSPGIKCLSSVCGDEGASTRDGLLPAQPPLRSWSFSCECEEKRKTGESFPSFTFIHRQIHTLRGKLPRYFSSSSKAATQTLRRGQFLCPREHMFIATFVNSKRLGLFCVPRKLFATVVLHLFCLELV